MSDGGQIIDAHVHVIDPARFPPPPGPGYKPQPEDVATAEALAKTFASHGVDHAILVQLSGYGTDNRCLVDAVTRSAGRWKAVAQVARDISDAELESLQRAGVVGVRFNVESLGPACLTGADALLDRMAARGFVAQVHCHARDLVALTPVLTRARCPLLFDHLGGPDPAAGPDEPGFRQLLAFGEAGAFIKLSGAFRLSREPPPHADLDPFVAKIAAAFDASHRIFGSDFPFVKCAAKPAYADTLAGLRRWIPDENERGLALRQNPARLFGFAL